jgi:class 3 adenylate cyclase
VEAKSTATVDELLDRAIEAVNRGDVEVAHQLANEVLAADATNPEAGDLLATDVSMGGELRRLTIMFCDLVGSTAMSARHEPERYRRIIVRYKSACRRVIEEQYDGHIADVKGDGVLAVLGHPSAHEDDAERAVRAGLEIAAEVLELSGEAQRGIGETLAARVAVHRGLVFLDTEEDDIYGLAVNVAARLQELAPPGGLVISDEVLRLVGNRFETAPQAAQAVKGVEAPLASWVVVRERFGGRRPSSAGTRNSSGCGPPGRRDPAPSSCEASRAWASPGSSAPWPPRSAPGRTSWRWPARRSTPGPGSTRSGR